MIGTTLGHYEIEGRLGQGGMGTVYRARDTVLGRTVAIKVLTTDAVSDADAARRILREARAASRLNHPNIVTVHEVASGGETEFLVMEYVEGRSLAALVQPDGLPIDRVLDYAAQIADALAAAHEAGLVHGDVKPGNVMVMPTDRVKVLDFGLARHLPAAPADETRPATAEFTRHGAAGTIGYMAPEQIEGRPADARSDVFALGVVMFELLSGHRPFRGDTAWATMNATMNSDAPDISRLRTDIPPGLVRVVARALAREPDNRYPSARALATELVALRTPAVNPPERSRRRIAITVATCVAIGAIAAAGSLWQRSSRANKVRTITMPQIARDLGTGDFDAAYRRAREALAILPGDTYLQQLWANATQENSFTSDPPGAEVAIKGFLSKNDWVPIGVTPLTARVPFGLLRWRITKPGYEPLEISGAGHEVSAASLVPSASARQMAFVARGVVGLDTGSVDVPDYWIDQYEVTNRQFKQFVDAGGYRNREYWREPFIKDGREIGWDQAIKEFHDPTGRPGPSTWDVGSYPQGQDNHPVSGVSWYEAAAYAVYAKKQLPTVFHWYRASGAFSIFSDVLAASNFSGRGTAAVGASGAVNLFGTLDMAGNVKEWCANATQTGRRYVLGGSFADAPWQFRDQDAQSPFERRAGFGLRLMEPAVPLDAKMMAPLATVERDPATLKPVSDEVYRVYARQFDYDRTPLDVVAEGTQDTPEWRREKISVLTAYGKERLPIYVFVPASAKPPFQAVVFYPGSNANVTSSSQNLALQWADFIVRSGRVLVYPVYKGTYERRISGPRGPGVLRELTIQRGKDLRRALDYLESRSDIDVSKVGFYGVSLGAQLGPEWLAIEPRFKTGVLLAGGFETWNLPPEIEPMNYAPHVTVPVLMVNGREDFDLPYETAQVPMFKMLGSAKKEHKTFEGGHIPVKPQEPIKAMLDWFDLYLGPVRK